MSNQRVSNERKKELEQLDPFQENLLKVMAYVQKNKKQLLLILGAVVVVAVIFSGIMVSFQRSENNASDLLAQAVEQYNQVAEDPVKGYEAVQDTFKTILDEYANTSAGKLARVKYAKICHDAAAYDQAYALYQEAYDMFKNQAGMQNFLLSSLGHVCLAKGDLEKAASYFSQIEKGADNLLKDEALFALAGLYQARNDAENSRKMYEKLIADHETSMYRALAESEIAGGTK